MSETINRYELVEPLTNANAGFAKWGHALRGGRDYFIKEFLNPCYPTDDSPYDEAAKRRIRESCEIFEMQRSLFYSQLNKTSDGNLVRIEEFFRWDGKYYVTTQWLETVRKSDLAHIVASWASSDEPVDIEDLCELDERSRIRLCLSLSHALMKLHDVSIVHADLKPGNIVLVKTELGGVAAKVIDVDSGFFESEPPDELSGDQVYFAPESILHMLQVPGAPPVGRPIDVFALGLIFHQLLAGSLPSLPDDYNYAYEACLEGCPLEVAEAVPPNARGIVADMMSANAADRPTMAEVFAAFWKCLHGDEKPLPFEVRGALETRKRNRGPSVQPPDRALEPKDGPKPAPAAEAEDSRVRISMGLMKSDDGKGGEAGSATAIDEAFYRPKGF